MTDLALAPARAAAPATGAMSAAGLGARIEVPRRLSVRYLSWVGFRTSFDCWGLMSLTCRRRCCA